MLSNQSKFREYQMLFHQKPQSPRAGKRHFSRSLPVIHPIQQISTLAELLWTLLITS